MIETKFTIGHWVVKEEEEDKNYLRVRGTRLGHKFKIANVDTTNYHEPNTVLYEKEKQEAIANANLIAAAPEMYEMLKECLDDELEMHGTTSLSDKISKLLAKARGEQYVQTHHGSVEDFRRYVEKLEKEVQ